MLKFLIFFKLALMNQRGELNEGDNSETGSTDVSDATSTEQSSGDSTSTSQDSSADDSLESRLDKFEVSKEDGDKGGDLLSNVNGFELVNRDGSPFAYEDEARIKEDLMKGRDYTYKTQEHAEQVKLKEAEFAKRGEEFEAKEKKFYEQQDLAHDDLVGGQVMAQYLEKFKASNPDEHEEFMQGFQAELQNYQNSVNNPAMTKLQKNYNDLEKRITDRDAKEIETKDSKAVNGFKKEQASYQTKYGPKLRSLGIRRDETKIEKIWSADTTGKMTYSQAVQSAYGDTINKALEAKNKLLETTNKSIERRGPTNHDPDAAPVVEKRETSYERLVRRFNSKNAS